MLHKSPGIACPSFLHKISIPRLHNSKRCPPESAPKPFEESIKEALHGKTYQPNTNGYLNNHLKTNSTKNLPKKKNQTPPKKPEKASPNKKTTPYKNKQEKKKPQKTLQQTVNPTAF